MGVGVPSTIAVPAAPTAAPAPAVATADSGAAAPAAAPVAAPVPFATRLAASTPVVANPQPQTVGRRSFSAIACTFDGPPIVGESDSIGSIQPAPDGSIYVVDQDHKVRHYTVARGDTCRLTLDTAFGRNGILSLDTTVRELSIDRRGRVLASSGSGHSWWISEGQVQLHCQSVQHGYTNVTPRGDVAFAHFVGSPIRRVTYTDSSCSADDWTYENPLYQVHSMAVDARQVLLGGSQSSGSSDQVSAYTLDGHLTARMGGAQGTGPDGICWARRVTTCRAGVCVADSNCHRLQMFDRRGGFVGSVDLDALLGVRTVWLQDLDVPRRGPSYASVSVARSGADSVYEGMIFRIDGI